MPRVLGGFWGDGRVLMGEVPMYGVSPTAGARQAQHHRWRAKGRVRQRPGTGVTRE
jgi:hypothetical protein